MKTILIVVGALVLLALLVGGPLIGARNELVTDREAINGAWSQVDVALQRRADLIPNLVETVKGFAAQEKAVIQAVADARSALVSGRTPQERIAANNQLDSALSRLLVVVENYPQLKSNENFLRLQDELAGTENRIAVARTDYNNAVRDYNAYIRRFPAVLTAKVTGAKSREYFEAAASAAGVPAVKF